MEIARNNPFWIVLGIVVLALGVLILLPFAQENVGGKAESFVTIRNFATTYNDNFGTSIPDDICATINTEQSGEITYSVDLTNNDDVSIGTSTCTQSGSGDSPSCVCTSIDSDNFNLDLSSRITVSYLIDSVEISTTTCSNSAGVVTCADGNMWLASILTANTGDTGGSDTAEGCTSNDECSRGSYCISGTCAIPSRPTLPDGQNPPLDGRPTRPPREGTPTNNLQPICSICSPIVDCTCLQTVREGYCVSDSYECPFRATETPTQLRRMFSTTSSGMDSFVSQWKFDEVIDSYEDLVSRDPETAIWYPDPTSETFTGSFTPNTRHGFPPGELHGSSLSPDGVVGTSMAFGGSPDYIEVKDFPEDENTELDLEGDFTISFWVKVDEDFSDYGSTGTIIYKDLGRVVYQVFLVPKVGNSFQVNFKLVGSSGNRIVQSDISLKRGEWNHIIARLNGDKMSLFLNGVFNKDESISGRDLDSASSVYIGAQPKADGTGYVNHFKGLLDELTLYGRALTEEEITALYERDRCAVDSFNVFCPTREEVASLEPIIRSYLQRIAEYVDDLYPNVNELRDVKNDLSENFGVFGFNSLGVENRMREPITYFVHKNKAYVLELTEPYDAFNGVVHLGVRNIGSTEYIEEFDLELDEEYSKFYLPPMTYSIDLDGNGDDAYMHFQGYFNYNAKGKLGLIAVIDPLINFDFLSIGDQVLLDLEPRQFIYDQKPYEMAFVQEGTQNIMVIDEHQYYDYEGFGEYGTHNFDELGHFGVNFEHPADAEEISTPSSGSLPEFHHGIYRLTEFNRFPTNLENTYQDYFTVSKTMPLGRSVRSGTVFSVSRPSRPKGSFVSRDFDSIARFLMDGIDRGAFAPRDSLDRGAVKDASRPVGPGKTSDRGSFGGAIATGLATDSYYSGLDAGDTLKVCSLNFPDPFVVDVCRTVGDTPVFGLEADVPSLVEGFDTELFYYRLPEGDDEKKVDAYFLHDLTEPIEEPRRFAYNLVKGRGFAFFVLDEETADFYILNHPAQADLDFHELTLETLTDKDLPPPLAKAEDYRVVFNLPVERFAESNDNMFRQIKVERITDRETLDTEDVKYMISAETKVDNIVDLEREFETWVDTYGYVTITDVGTIRLNPTDVTTAKNFMDIAIDNDAVQLVFEEPKVVDNMLFIYNLAETRDSFYHSKKADIHLFYDLKEDSISHPFTDKDFTIPMMKGKEIALGIDDKYYLFGYNPSRTVGDPDPVTDFFEEKELVLKRVNGVETIAKETKSGEVIFTLASRQKVRVTFETEDLEDKEVIISLEEPSEIKQITSFDFASGLYVELPEWTAAHDKVLQIGRDEYYNCDTDDTKTFQTYTLLCKKGSMAPIKLDKNSPVLERDFLVTYRGLLGTKKLVTFQKILGDLSYSGSEIANLDWSGLRDNLTKNKVPAISVDGTYYDLLGGNTFSELRFTAISSGEIFSNQPYIEAEGASKGMIVVDGNVYSLEQSLADYKVTLNLKKEEFKFITSEGLVVEGIAAFVSRIGKEVYIINVEGLRDKVKVTLSKGDKPFFIRTLPISSQRILLPNKDVIHLEVINDGMLKVRISDA